MAIEVMSRYENKYLVDTDIYLKIQKCVEDYADLDQYNLDHPYYTISNIYYDTDDHYLIKRSLSKPVYKEKIRLRGYGVPAESDTVFLELKKKFMGCVNKRRTSFALPQAYEMLETYSTPAHIENPQIAGELEFALRTYAPKPKVYIAYDRRAYFGDNNLRITFDTNIRTRRYDLRLEAGDYGEPLLGPDVWLIETKTNGNMPIWLARMLSENRAYSTGFSKYGTEYRKYLVNGGAQQCLNPYLMPQATAQSLPSHGKVWSQQLA